MRIMLYKSPDDEIFLVDRDADEVVKFSTEGISRLIALDNPPP